VRIHKAVLNTQGKGLGIRGRGAAVAGEVSKVKDECREVLHSCEGPRNINLIEALRQGKRRLPLMLDAARRWDDGHGNPPYRSVTPYPRQECGSERR